MGRFNRVAGSPGPVDALINVADMGMRLYGQKQQAAAGAAKQARQQRIDDIEYGTGDPATRGMYQTDANMGGVTDMSNYQPGLKERAQILTEQKWLAEQNNPKNAHARNMAAPPDITKIIAASKNPEYSSLAPMFNSAIEHISSGNAKTKQELYICNPIYLLTYDAKDHPVITKIIGMWQWL